ncbi:16S rRNA (uracil(1498)-N(3))-methyltransferase [Limnobacter humi]|uniref:Ribosomal RNA small subunit methyltransferase E n=1 Tax=Limnobacter humi TaxID=1778671 RepID=A0ABT1WH22_9BURK|nr:16S rRNA (uracil(1498)-N(3))-methyltransferase [Limnobacter humi]MCQ8896817.1 16S rRNA (uracil(1498)-N(3))-methyltransferase [Limnobacter humi]
MTEPNTVLSDHRHTAATRRVPRFYLPQAKAQGQVLPLEDDLLHYASRVLRLREGEALRAWNGAGIEFDATVHYLSKKLGEVRLNSTAQACTSTELTRAVYVLQGLPEGDKMDWVIEKCTELGAQGFFPVQAQRSVVKLNDERAEKRRLHWDRVALAAGLQSERACLPVVAPVAGLETQLQAVRQQLPNAQVMLFTPQADTNLRGWLNDTAAQGDSPLVIAVGPEGGWTPDEIETAIQSGAQCLRFSNRVLRTETFGMACLSQLVGLLNLDSFSQ